MNFNKMIAATMAFVIAGGTAPAVYHNAPVSFMTASAADTDYEQVTSGGISGECVDDRLQLRSEKGIFLCGEILDIDGDCGGYNLQWAWSSGIFAGRNCAESLRGAAL